MKTVTPSLAIKVVGFLCLALSVAGAVLGICYGVVLLQVTACALFAVGALCIILWYRVRITFSAATAQWTMRRWFFPRQHFAVTDIRAITFGTAAGGFTLHLSRGRLRVGRYAKNGVAFRAWVEKKYLRAYRKPIPYEPPRLFRNNIQNPWSFLFFSIAAGLLLLALAICGTVYLLPERDEPDLVAHTALINAVERTGNYVQLSTDLGDLTAPAMEADWAWNQLAKSEVVLQIAERDTIVWGMAQKDGTVLFTPEDVRSYVTRLNGRNITILWLVALVYWLLFAVSCYILHNAARYPRLAALLIRPEKRNFSM